MYTNLLYKTYSYYECRKIALKESTPAFLKDPHTIYKTWCQKWEVSKDLGSMDIEAMNIITIDMTSLLSRFEKRKNTK